MSSIRQVIYIASLFQVVWVTYVVYHATKDFTDSILTSILVCVIILVVWVYPLVRYYAKWRRKNVER